MTCEELDRWLDQGAPEAGADAVHAHAAACARCSEILRADQDLERALSRAPAPAPTGFTDRVMARVASAPRPAPMVAPALPWWIRVAMEPVTVLALAAAGGIAWGWQGLWSLAAASRSAFAGGAHWLPLGFELSETGGLALQLALGSLLALSAGALFRATGRLARRIPMTRP